MINLLLFLPVLLGLLMLIFANKKFQNFALNLYAIIHFIASCVLVFGLNVQTKTQYFALDGLNKIFLLILSFVFLMTVMYNNGYSKHIDAPVIQLGKFKFSFYNLMILIFVWAMTGAILSSNLGLSWVFVETTTLASAYLIFFNRTKNSIEAAWKYVFICSIGIALAFVGIIFLNVSTMSVNSLNFDVLYHYAKNFDPTWLKLSGIFMIFGFGTKMGVAPVHFWLPDAHSEAPTPISALLSATLLNSAFLVILRVYKILTIAGCEDFTRIILFAMGFLSVFVTAVFVYHIKNYKRMLAYSSIENMGILFIATALGKNAYYALILHLVGHSLAKASFFLTSGNVLELFNSKRIKSVSALVKADFKTAFLWIASFLAICAFPTSVLFISEFLIIKEMIIQKHYILAIVFVLLLTVVLWGIARAVIKMSFGKESPDKMPVALGNKTKLTISMYLPQIVMIIIVFTLGIYIPPIVNNVIKSAISAL